MSPAPITYQVDQKVFVEFVAVSQRHAGGGHTRFDIIGIDMHDGDFEALGEVTRIERGAAIVGVCGKADLVVEDDMNRPTDAVAFEVRHVEGFGNHSLTGEGRIAVDDDGQ